jgi:hypothetical protein
LWGGERVEVSDHEAWLDIISKSDRASSGAWWTITLLDGSEKRFRSADFPTELQNESFRNAVLSIVEEELITKFDKQTGNASNYYNIESED